MAAAVSSEPIETRIMELGGSIRAAEPRPPLRDRASEAMLSVLEDRPAARAALFRFVDAAPACGGAHDRGAHLRAYLREVPRSELPPALRPLVWRGVGAPLAVAAGVLSPPAIRLLARRFIAGSDIAAAAGELTRSWRAGKGLAVDLLGEATVTAAEADDYRNRCRLALEQLSRLSAAWPPHPTVPEADRHGPLPRANLSIKLSALTSLIRPQAPERGAADAAWRLHDLLVAARDCGAHLHLDVESLDTREAMLQAVEEVLAGAEFRSGPSVGLVVQAYLRDAEDVLERILASPLCEREPALTVRLVKGAYWEHETADAAQHGWRTPVWESKARTDRSFERLTERLVAETARVRPAIASHNLRSLSHAIAVNEAAGGRPEDLELQVLRGLGDSLASALAAEGWRVRVYTPVGDLIAGMAYLVRRLLGNTSTQGFLAKERHVPLDELLEAPD